jgi:hypothetical protein
MAQRTVIAAWLAILVVGCAGPPSPSSQPNPSGPAAAAAMAASPSQAPTAKPTPKPTPTPTPRPTHSPVPPKPSGVAFHQRGREDDDGHFAYISQRVTWKEPRTKGVEIRVYGVTECLAEPKPLPTEPSGGPCLVKGTKLPASVRTLLATAPASDGVARWRWREESGCNPGLEYDNAGPAIYSIVLAAYNEAGHSIFAIAEPGGWQVYDPNDIVC